MKTKKIAVIGTGMIGCSFALAARRAFPGIHISGADNNMDNLSLALATGMIDETGTIGEIAGDADIILICTPVDTIAGQALTALDNSSVKCIVMDAGSVKKPICDALAGHPQRHRFVAAHPVAGTENHGPGAAAEGLFNAKVCFICDRNNSSETAMTAAGNFFASIGMQIVYSDAADHDVHMANLSHLSHMIAYGLALASLDAEPQENIISMSGSGFASTVRLAKSHASMWAPIFSMNRENVLQAMGRFMTRMEQLRIALRTDDMGALEDMISCSNRLRNIMDKKNSLKVAI